MDRALSFCSYKILPCAGHLQISDPFMLSLCPDTSSEVSAPEFSDFRALKRNT